jgi:hypothetical protein
MDEALKTFLIAVVGNRLRLEILFYFLRNGGSFLSTEDLAVKIGRETKEVKEAVIGLHAAGILLYTPFGYSDICFLDGEKHTPEITQNLKRLAELLEKAPSEAEKLLQILP